MWSRACLIQWRFRMFTTNCLMKKGGQPADHGTLNFGLDFSCSPYFRITDATTASRMVTVCRERWGLPKPRALMSVIGGAADFAVGERLIEAFNEGFAKAAKQTGAWVIAGGTNSGAMAVTGQAFAGETGTVLLGVLPWGCVHHRDVMADAKWRQVLYPKAPLANSREGAQVERNHSHFIMVDNGRTGSRGWGGENSFRVRLEAAISQEVPSVTIVMGGG